MGMKTFDTNSSGKSTALTTAGEASAFGMIAVIASPRAEKAGRADHQAHDEGGHRADWDTNAVGQGAEGDRDDDEEPRHRHGVDDAGAQVDPRGQACPAAA